MDPDDPASIVQQIFFGSVPPAKGNGDPVLASSDFHASSVAANPAPKIVFGSVRNSGNHDIW
ncbi:MAG TPA: hypothetical protein DCK99_05325 [Blastocatellia bacterium]|nr:hypothetical protein [Blastocatellia bacterium]